MSKLFNEPIKIHSSGRTDKGVHAEGQVVNFQTRSNISLERLAVAINQKLPNDIVVRKVEEVAENFHARKSALGKVYQYKIYNSKIATAFGNQYFYWVPYQLDEDLIRQGCQLFEGRHDFQSFCATGSSIKTYTRTLYHVRLERKGDWWQFGFYGDGFLYNMVRIIIGTLLEVGSHRRPLESITAALKTPNRRLAGKTAPPHGLYLKNVYYP